MSSLKEIDYIFRGHHVGNELGILMRHSGLSKDDVNEIFSLPVDWNNTSWNSHVLKVINTGFRDYVFNYQSNDAEGCTGNGWSCRDYFGNGDTKSRLNKADELTMAEVQSISVFFTADSSSLVMIGSVKDSICSACAIGKHCTRPSNDRKGMDTELALRIKSSCDILNIPCLLRSTPDNIYVKYEDGNLKKGKVAILRLGDLRDYFLRRILYLQSEIKKLDQEMDELFLPLQVNRSSQEVLRDFHRIDDAKAHFRLLSLDTLELSPVRERDLQRMIDESRSG